MTIAVADWIADDTISPFAVKAIKSLSTDGSIVMGMYDEISLAYANTEAKKARDAGMCIGELFGTGTGLTFYAVTAPTEQIQALVIITPTTLSD